MYCMPWKPFQNCFRATSTKKNTICCPKMAKKCQSWPKSVFCRVWVVIWCPCCPTLRVLVSKKEVTHAVEAISQVFQGRQDLKECQFLRQISVFCVRMVSWCPPYPILRVLKSSGDMLHAIEPIQQVSQGRHHQKNTIFGLKLAKKKTFYPKLAFSGSGWSVGAPLPYVEGSGLVENVSHAVDSI